MWELRWVLLGLGAAVVVGVYLLSRGMNKRRVRAETARTRTEPMLGVAIAEPVPGPLEAEHVVAPAPPPKPRRPAERVIALRLIPRSGELGSARAVQAMTDLGLEHGRYKIFHLHDELSGNEPVFSVASLTEPGTFDVDSAEDTTIAGLSLFVVLPGTGDPVERFDRMIETARALAVELAAELRDERGSSWSVQRERYVREELIDYRHQLERH